MSVRTRTHSRLPLLVHAGFFSGRWVLTDTDTKDRYELVGEFGSNPGQLYMCHMHTLISMAETSDAHSSRFFVALNEAREIAWHALRTDLQGRLCIAQWYDGWPANIATCSVIVIQNPNCSTTVLTHRHPDTAAAAPCCFAQLQAGASSLGERRRMASMWSSRTAAFPQFTASSTLVRAFFGLQCGSLPADKRVLTTHKSIIHLPPYGRHEFHHDCRPEVDKWHDGKREEHWQWRPIAPTKRRHAGPRRRRIHCHL